MCRVHREPTGFDETAETRPGVPQNGGNGLVFDRLWSKRDPIHREGCGVGHGGIDKVGSSWTLRGWSPPWTRASVTLRGLKSPSTWMYDSTTYRNHAKNICVSNCV